MTRESLLQLLWDSADEYISGAELARRLAVSRTAVWKAVEQLRGEGYEIESVTRRGYRLCSRSDVLSAAGIERHLKTKGLQLQVFRSVSSTNAVLKAQAAEGAPEGLVAAACQQTAGRGRMGRSFYSPADTGLYLSVLLRPQLRAEQSTDITACAAVAAAGAIEALSGRQTQIKWVNDLLLDGKKVCGILTEASVDCESGLVNYLIVGIGVNARAPAGGFPEELRDIAGAVFGPEGLPELRCRLAAAILDRLMDGYAHLEERAFFEEYRRRSLVPGKPIRILTPGRPDEDAQALAIEPDFSLLVRGADGALRSLRFGEVSIRTK